MQSYPAELLRPMLEIYSPSGSEARLAEFLHQQMVAKGFKVRRDHAGNVIGELGLEGPRVLLCGHMDTVPGEITVRTEEEIIYGRGAVDAKSSLAAMIAGSSIAAERGPNPFRVTVAAVVEEETTSAGARALLGSGNSYDFAIFGEPSGAANIIVGYKGSVQLHVACRTKGGHSAAPWLSSNSFEEAAEFWRNFKNSVLENDSRSKFTAITGCVTNIAAGDTPNSIPSEARLVIDVRIPPTVKADEMVNRVEDFVEDYQAKRNGVHFSMAATDRTEAYLGSEDSVPVSAFRWAIKKTMGQQASLVKKTGTSDMNLFGESASFPMIAYGPGDSSFDHTENEGISLSEYLSSVEVYANAIQQLAHLSRNRTLMANTLQ